MPSSLGIATDGGDHELHYDLWAFGLKPEDRIPPGSAEAAEPWPTVEDDSEGTTGIRV